MPRTIVFLTNPIAPQAAAELGRHAEVRLASAVDAATLRREARDAMFAGELPRHLCNPEAREAILARWSTLSSR
jgi:hypothetical protein